MRLPEIKSTRLVRLIVLPALVGVVAGLGSIFFYVLLETCKHFAMDLLAGHHPGRPGGEEAIFTESKTALVPWLLLVLPIVGGLIGGILVFTTAPEAEGHGTDAVIDAYHRKGGVVRARVPLVKSLASAITIGTGGSAGKEGPIAQIGAGFGSMLAGWLRLPADYRRVLLTAGMSGGIGAIFHAPMAGALFASEVHYRDMELEGEVLVPATISSIVAYTVFAAKFGWNPLFDTPDLAFTNGVELVPYTILALCVALGALAYARCFYLVRAVFRRIPGPPHFKPAIGGVFVGIIGYAFAANALGGSYGTLQEALDGTFAGTAGITALLGLALWKVLATSFTIGSGGSGGMFGPSIVIGGALGGSVGLALDQLLPAMVDHPQSFVLVGMAGFFAAAANTPISTVIMVSEMTGSYNLILPTLWVSMIAFILLRRTTIYETQPASHLDSPAHLHEMMAEILRRIRVRDALGEDTRVRVTISHSARLTEIQRLFAMARQEAFPVLDEKGRPIGILDNAGLRATAGQPELLDLIVAEDLAVPAPSVTPDDDLLVATQLMKTHEVAEILVVEPGDEGRIMGILMRHRILSIYAERALAEQQGAQPSRSQERPKP